MLLCQIWSNGTSIFTETRRKKLSSRVSPFKVVGTGHGPDRQPMTSYGLSRSVSRISGDFSRNLQFSFHPVHLTSLELCNGGWDSKRYSCHMIHVTDFFHVVSKWLGRWTCDQQVASSNPGLSAIECNPGQVVNTHVPLSLSSIIWYQPMGGDALWLGR